MTDVIKRNGKREPFNVRKVRKSVENAISDAGFTLTDKMGAIEHATGDVESLAQNRDKIKSQEIRNEVINDLESEVPEAAQAWKNYEKQHRIS